MFSIANEAIWIMLGGTTISGIWGVRAWKIRRRDQKEDKAESSAVKTISIAQKAEKDKIVSDIATTSARVDKIEKEDMKAIEGRLSVLETAQIGFEAMQKLLNDSLTTHLTPLTDGIRNNTNEISELQKKVFQMELEAKLEAKYKNNQSG